MTHDSRSSVSPLVEYSSPFPSSIWPSKTWLLRAPSTPPDFDSRCDYYWAKLVEPLLAIAPDARARCELLVHHLYATLLADIGVEIDTLVRVCTWIARDHGFLPWLPAAVRADALKFLVDETAHAQLTRALLERVVKETGLPTPESWGTGGADLSDLLPGAPADDLRVLEVLNVVVTVTLITKILLLVPSDATVQLPERQALQYHADDEGRHRRLGRPRWRVKILLRGATTQRSLSAAAMPARACSRAGSDWARRRRLRESGVRRRPTSRRR